MRGNAVATALGSSCAIILFVLLQLATTERLYPHNNMLEPY